MGKKTQIMKQKVTPKAMMEECDVDFVSLVKQGANKQKFAMFKSGEKEDVEKRIPTAFDIADTPGLGSSFSGAMDAINTAEKLEESRNTLEESFFVLKMVIKGVLEDNEVTDKSKGLKKAAGEFADFVGKLFDGISVQKASEMLNMEGNMKVVKKASDGGSSEVEKAAKGGGASSNGEQPAKNRNSQSTEVKGISKKEKGMVKMLTSAIVKATGEIETMMALDFAGNKDNIEKAEANIEAMETQIEEIEKASGAVVEGTGEDTVASNGDEAAGGDVNHDNASAEDTGATGGEVAKAGEEEGDGDGEGKGKPFGGKKAPPFGKKDGGKKGKGVKKEGEEETEGDEANNGSAEVEKNSTIGTTNPDTGSTQEVTGQAGSVNEKNGNLTLGAFKSFMQEFQVSLDGKLGAQSNLIKEQSEKIAAIEKGHRKVDAITKMHGLSNAQDLDFTPTSEEKVATQKSEDTEWSSAVNGTGSLKGNSKRG